MNAMIEKQDDARIMESVLLDGDLSKLSPAQRVSYYLSVCESLGLNPKTKPFKYITLNGKLTLYAQKDATDQLRKLHKVSIDDVDIKETDSQFIVKVKGHDEGGRSDVEVGVVNKSDMRGDTANAQMKAVTKSKRRLTLSICGLGFLDETEVGTIPDARPMVVTEDGEIKGPEWSAQAVTAGESPMGYDVASEFIVTTSKGPMHIGEMAKPELDAVIAKMHNPRAVEAARVVLQHDFGMEPITAQDKLPFEE